MYNKYEASRESKSTKFDLGNKAAFTNITPGSFMPRVPFLILRGSKNPAMRKIILIHNILCFVVYGLFVTAFILFAKSS
jgi:hypothetical protein